MIEFVNPFRERAAAAADEAEAARRSPHLRDVDLDDLEAAMEAARVAAIVERTRRQREARARADELAARADRMDRAVAEHDAAEAREVERVNGLIKSLDTSRRALVDAAKTADAALLALWGAAEEHDALVVQSSVELRAAGLVDHYADADVATEFATGGGRDGLVLRGKRWGRVSPLAMLWRCLYGQLRARAALPHFELLHMRHARGVDRLERGSAGLLDRAPLPEPGRRAASPGRMSPEQLGFVAERKAEVVSR